MGLSAVPLSQDPWWRTISEPTFLMCPPEQYDVYYVINPWMEGNVQRVLPKRAMAQWEEFALRAVGNRPGRVRGAAAGLARHGFHRQRRTGAPRRWWRSAAFFIPSARARSRTSAGGSASRVSAMCDIPSRDAVRRRGRRAVRGRWFAPVGRAWYPRRRESSHRQLSETWKIEVISLRLVDRRFYHLDTCFCPLFRGYVMYYPRHSMRVAWPRLRRDYPEEKRIRVSEPDALTFRLQCHQHRANDPGHQRQQSIV